MTKFRWWALAAVVMSLYSFVLAIGVLWLWLYIKVAILGLKFIDWIFRDKNSV